jgi:hypothetical protein
MSAIFYITLERISTGERSPSMVVRQPTERDARKYAEAAIGRSSTPHDLRVVRVVERVTRRPRQQTSVRTAAAKAKD